MACSAFHDFQPSLHRNRSFVMLRMNLVCVSLALSPARHRLRRRGTSAQNFSRPLIANVNGRLPPTRQKNFPQMILTDDVMKCYFHQPYARFWLLLAID